MKTIRSETSTKELVQKLQNSIPALMETYQVPGLSFVIIRDADISWSQTFGVRSSVSQEPVTEDTVFEAASLSKPVFAYAALKLCESGLLDLDTPLSEYLREPYVPDEPRLNLLTMRHVLSHTTGFPNWRSENQPLKIHFPPGERFSYSGEGYMYLQAVLAHVTGQNSAEYMFSHVLQPFGMENSRYVWNGKEGLPVAIGHDTQGAATEKYLWQKMNAAASLHTTPTDFARFMCIVMRPSSDSPIHLGREMVAEMLSPQVQVNDSAPWDEDWPRANFKTSDRVSWGLGWGIQPTSHGDSIWHWGDNGNYRAYAEGDLEDGDGIVMMTNAKNGQKMINTIMYEIIDGEHAGLDWLYG